MEEQCTASRAAWREQVLDKGNVPEEIILLMYAEKHAEKNGQEAKQTTGSLQVHGQPLYKASHVLPTLPA